MGWRTPHGRRARYDDADFRREIILLMQLYWRRPRLIMPFKFLFVSGRRATAYQ